MGTVVPPLEPVAVEPAPAATFLVHGFHRISYLGNGMMLFTFYRLDVATDGHGEVEHLVEVKLMAHTSDVARMIRQATAAVAREAITLVKGPSIVM